MRAEPCIHPDARVRPLVRSGLLLCEDGELRRGHVYRCECGAVRSRIDGLFGSWLEPAPLEPTQVTRLPERRATSHAELRDAG